MSYPLTNCIHRLAAIIATLTIATFWLSTVIFEMNGDYQAIATVKSWIVLPGLLILIPAIIATGGSGFTLAKRRQGRLVRLKQKRMPFIAANGIFILIPCAIFLDKWAAAGAFGTPFVVVQGLELVAGAVNLTLMGLNMRDGLRLAGKLKPGKRQIN